MSGTTHTNAWCHFQEDLNFHVNITQCLSLHLRENVPLFYYKNCLVNVCGKGHYLCWDPHKMWSVRWHSQHTCWVTRQLEFISGGGGNFLFTAASRLALGPTLPPGWWIIVFTHTHRTSALPAECFFKWTHCLLLINTSLCYDHQSQSCCHELQRVDKSVCVAPMRISFNSSGMGHMTT
jgi:hypothetical protein